eukprot:60428-Amorphochlora_amoeboformis.AAC.1
MKVKLVVVQYFGGNHWCPFRNGNRCFVWQPPKSAQSLSLGVGVRVRSECKKLVFALRDWIGLRLRLCCVNTITPPVHHHDWITVIGLEKERENERERKREIGCCVVCCVIGVGQYSHLALGSVGVFQ